MNVFDEALISLQEAIDYEKGDNSKAYAVTRHLSEVVPAKSYTGEDIKKIRENQNYTQAYFGELVGVSLKCVQSWEYCKSSPNGSARRAISIIEQGEDFLKAAGFIAR